VPAAGHALDSHPASSLARGRRPTHVSFAKADIAGVNMNEVKLSGWFATEVAFGHHADGSDTASFIIRVPRETGADEDFFRVVCEPDAALAVAKVAQQRLLLGVPVELEGRLAQDVVQDSQGQEGKVVRVVAASITLRP
jgi:single-stranded DNA-binding protein